MRVAASGVWRRAFVRSCVSLRNRGCSKLSVVPLTVRFRWQVMLCYRAGKVTGVKNYRITSSFVCIICFSLHRIRTRPLFPIWFVITMLHGYIFTYLQKAVEILTSAMTRAMNFLCQLAVAALIWMLVSQMKISITLLLYDKRGKYSTAYLNGRNFYFISHARVARTTNVFLKVRILLTAAHSTNHIQHIRQERRQ